MKLSKVSFFRRFKLSYLLIMLILLYAPFFIFARSVYDQSVTFEKTERLKLKVQSFKRDAQTLNLRLEELKLDVDRLVKNPAIERSLRVYHMRDTITRKSLIKYLADKKDAILQKGFVEEMVFVTNERDILTASQYFSRMVETVDLSMTYDYTLMNFDVYDGYMNNKLFFFKTIESHSESSKKSLLIFVVDKKKLIQYMTSDFNDAVGFIDAKQGDVAYSQKLKDEFKIALRRSSFVTQTEMLGKIVLTERIGPFRWTVYSIIDADSLIVETKTNFMTHTWILFFFALFSSVVITLTFLISTDYRNEKIIAEHKYALSEDSNKQLRAYKHDLMNHLQIIQGLVEMERYEKAMAYIQKVGHEGAAIREKHKIGIPELEAAVFGQLSDCESYEIRTEVECIQLDEEFGYDTYELAKVLNNLVRNAKEALIHYNSKRILRFEIKRAASKYLFIVTNSGPIIDEEKRERIFTTGFSEKGDHRGYGLYIVRNAVEKLGGRLRLEIDMSGNHFVVELPVDQPVTKQ